MNFTDLLVYAETRFEEGGAPTAQSAASANKYGWKRYCDPAASLCVKSRLQELVEDDMLLIVDIANAYNTISRSAHIEEVKKHWPALARWAHWGLNGASAFTAEVRHLLPKQHLRASRFWQHTCCTGTGCMIMPRHSTT